MKTDKVEVAKELLKKAKQLGDPELLALASSMLDEPDKTHYACDNCGHDFYSEKVRKACPECRKRKLVVVEEQPEPVKDKSDFLAPVFQGEREQGPRKRYNPDTGEEEGSYGRTEQISPNVKPVDFDIHHEDTEDFDKKVKFSLSGRRPPVKYIKKKCSNPNCRVSFKVHPVHKKQHLCDKCSVKRKR